MAVHLFSEGLATFEIGGALFFALLGGGFGLRVGVDQMGRAFDVTTAESRRFLHGLMRGGTGRILGFVLRRFVHIFSLRVMMTFTI